MNSCKRCEAKDFLVVAEKGEVVLDLAGGKQIDLPDGIGDVLICRLCGEPNPTDEQELLTKGVTNNNSWNKQSWKPPRWIRRIRPDTWIPDVTIKPDDWPQFDFRQPRGSGGRNTGGGEGRPYQYIIHESGAPCGPTNMPFDVLRNTHQTRPIHVIVERQLITSRPGNYPWTIRFIVPPKSVVVIGCEIPDSSLNRYPAKITQVEWYTGPPVDYDRVNPRYV